MKITTKFLHDINACDDAIKQFDNQKKTDLVFILKQLMKQDNFNWANWLIVRCMTYKQYVSYAVYAAERVLHIYEKKYLENKTPQDAIKAAKKCINDPSIKNKKAAYVAADVAANVAVNIYPVDYAAGNASYAAYASAYAAANTAAKADAANAAYAADAADAANAAYAAGNAYAAYAAGNAYIAAYTNTQKKIQKAILNNGIKLLEIKK